MCNDNNNNNNNNNDNSDNNDDEDDEDDENDEDDEDDEDEAWKHCAASHFDAIPARNSNPEITPHCLISNAFRFFLFFLHTSQGNHSEHHKTINNECNAAL